MSTLSKKDFATLAYRANIMDSQLKFSVEKLAETLQLTFSTLATLDPRIALDVLAQLEEQKPEIIDFLEELESEDEESIAALIESVPSSVTFED